MVDDERAARLGECDEMADKWRRVSNVKCGFPKPKKPFVKH